MNVAIPELKGAVAPCFEAATSFALVSLQGEQISQESNISCTESGGYRRVRLLLFHNVEVLICNGISASHKDTLTAAGIAVISGVYTSVDEALNDLAQGRLKISQPAEISAGPACRYTHEQLVAWAHQLFVGGGYQVLPGPGEDYFLVDLVAEIDCPVCKRRVRVAICCGAHTYKSQQEIKAFHHATPAGYDARVYVCPAEEQILESCREYGIEVIDPSTSLTSQRTAPERRIPILMTTIAGHEQASANTERDAN